MPALPNASDLTGVGANTVIQYKTAITAMRDYLAGLLGTAGTIPAALAAIGGLAAQFITKTAAYTVVIGDRGDVISASNTWTLSLTAAASLGTGFNVILTNAGSGVITVDPSGAELVDGVATITIPAGAASLLVCTGTAWISLPFQRPAQTGTSDATANRLMFTGAFGLGGNAITTEDFDAITSGGRYRNATTGCVGAPAAVINYSLFHHQISASQAAQLAIRSSAANEVWYRRKTSSVWQPWVQVTDSSNFVATIQSLGRFTSADQTVTLSGSLTLAHSLGAAPYAKVCHLKCTTAAAGYTIGVVVDAGISGVASFIDISDTTNVGIRFSAAVNVPHKTTGVATAITAANWRLVVKAWL